MTPKDKNQMIGHPEMLAMLRGWLYVCVFCGRQRFWEFDREILHTHNCPNRKRKAMKEQGK